MNQLESSMVIFGGGGQVGDALINALLKQGYRENQIHAIPWSLVGNPKLVKNAKRLEDFLLSKVLNAKNTTLVFANGITNAREDPEKISYSNLEFPKFVIDAVKLHENFRFLTLGTIQENFPELCQGNSYLRSKLDLGRQIEALSKDYPNRFAHVRMHTLYGGKPRPHMFLGLMLDSIVKNEKFAMSSGEQLREYHHVKDISKSLVNLIQKDWNEIETIPTIEINSGSPVRLSDLAKAVFKAYKKDELLNLGSVQQPDGENVTKVFKKSPKWLLPESRSAVSGVIHSLLEFHQP